MLDHIKTLRRVPKLLTFDLDHWPQGQIIDFKPISCRGYNFVSLEIGFCGLVCRFINHMKVICPVPNLVNLTFDLKVNEWIFKPISSSDHNFLLCLYKGFWYVGRSYRDNVSSTKVGFLSPWHLWLILIFCEANLLSEL